MQNLDSKSDSRPVQCLSRKTSPAKESLSVVLRKDLVSLVVRTKSSFELLCHQMNSISEKVCCLQILCLVLAKLWFFVQTLCLLPRINAFQVIWSKDLGFDEDRIMVRYHWKLCIWAVGLFNFLK